ncbi:SusD/RagB family nutrient-binding outer membrane lipoprotein [Parasediminibacterium paludis]|uniref:SusD/RagB family nutrient-binding outer membrane lipoprotein n=1 Tax=Parasediminibacterium paludis TaxID=908966 RepID=A0ABV8PT60_9BACT
MKKKLYKTSSIIGLLAIVGVVSLLSCSKKLDDNYLNPNNPVEVPIESILPNVINQMTSTAAPPAGGGGGSYGPATDAVLLGRYIQFWNLYTTGDNYDQMGGVFGTASDNTGNVWAMHYYGIGANAKYIISRGTDQQKWDYVGVAHAVFAFSWLTLTEQYGEVILKEAFNTSQSQFDYDPQSAVYDSVRKICDNAIAYLNRTDGNVSPTNLALGDTYFYGGDVNKWKKFVYAIKARSFAHLSNKSFYATQGYADSVLKYVDLSITSNADNATQKWVGGNFSGLNNYYGAYRGNIATLRQSAFIADLLTGASTASPFTGIFDPRTPYLINENAVLPITKSTVSYKGVVPNLGTTSPGLSVTANQPKNFWRQPFSSTSTGVPDSGRYIFNNLAEFPVITACDLQFMKAEAAFRKGDKSTALQAYKNGINLSFELLTTKYGSRIPDSLKITPASQAAYLANPAVVPLAATDLTLSQIMLQKYIALYGYGFHETWTDMRRYHYVDLDPVTGKQVYAGFTLPTTLTQYNNGKLAYRCRPRYNSEYLYNIPALQAIGALASDYHTKEQWFTQP